MQVGKHAECLLLVAFSWANHCLLLTTPAAAAAADDDDDDEADHSSHLSASTVHAVQPLQSNYV